MALLEYEHYSDVPQEAWSWPHFTPQEIACSHCGAVKLDTGAMDKVEAARLLYGRPIIFASFYRCPAHPIEAAKAGGPGSHSTGAACDPYPARNGDLAEMEDAFFKVGVLGRGKGKKDGKLHLHFDWSEAHGKRSWGY